MTDDVQQPDESAGRSGRERSSVPADGPDAVGETALVRRGVVTHYDFTREIREITEPNRRRTPLPFVYSAVNTT